MGAGDQNQNQNLTASLAENEQFLREALRECADAHFRRMPFEGAPRVVLVYLDGLVATAMVDSHVVKALQERNLDPASVEVAQVATARNLDQILNELVEGKLALLTDGSDQALMLDVQGVKRRSVKEPETESLIRGPREGFVESLRTNTALLRMKLKTPQLKLIGFTIGKRSRTRIELAYLEGVADPKVIAEARRRLEAIEIDAVLESGYIEELIEDAPFSVFPQLMNTERPDSVAAQLLEGRFAIFTDGTPYVLVGPVVIWQMLQASEDYYERWPIALFLRILRFFLIFLSLYLPAIYVAVTTFHQDMLPTSLLLSVAASREPIPFPSLIEALIMEIAFEALREAGIRLPQVVGQTVSILGALVIGQAAVQAGIVSAPIVIIVSLTGIASFTAPRYNIGIPIRLLRFPLMALGGTLGLFGLVLGAVWLVTHLAQVRSFGVPFLEGVAPLETGPMKDMIFRAPWWLMRKRPRAFDPADSQRVPPGQKPGPPDGGQGQGRDGGPGQGGGDSGAAPTRRPVRRRRRQ